MLVEVVTTVIIRNSVGNNNVCAKKDQSFYPQCICCYEDCSIYYKIQLAESFLVKKQMSKQYEGKRGFYFLLVLDKKVLNHFKK